MYKRQVPKTSNNTEPSSTTPKVTSSTPSPSTPVAVSGVALNKKVATVNVGKKVTVKATVTPANADNKTLAWTSSNTKIATVSNGVVKGVKAGRVIITAKTTDGSNISATCTVTVKQPVTRVKFNKSFVKLTKKGNSATLKATAYPSNANVKKLTIKSENTKVVKVSKSRINSGATFKVTAVKKGTAYVRATATDGSKKYARIRITVKK